jgi:muramoyltetrapeptide carboxypeptidase
MRKPLKPPALAPGSTIAVVSPASSAKQERVRRGCDNLEQLDYRVRDISGNPKPDGYFAGPFESRRKELQEALTNPEFQAVFCSRGGYGSAELLSELKTTHIKKPKIFCAFSDLTSLHVFLWEKLRWVTFYGPLVAGGFDAGANATGGYDPDSFMCSMTATNSAWSTPLRGETLVRGTARGVMLGGCVTLVETTLGTPWELDTRGAILLLEDRGLKPYQLDRMLLHLLQAGKFKGVRGIVLGEFPESEPPNGSAVTVGEVCRRILGPLQIPIVYGAPIGHTPRPMLTLPLGINARLHASGEGHLEILEPAVRP